MANPREKFQGLLIPWEFPTREGGEIHFGWVGCNNLFYIKDGKVVEYVPTGKCFTDETVRPESRYIRLMNPAKP